MLSWHIILRNLIRWTLSKLICHSANWEIFIWLFCTSAGCKFSSSVHLLYMVEMPWSQVYERIYNTYSKILVNFLVCKLNSAIYILHHRNICKTLRVQDSSRRGSRCPVVLHLHLLKSIDNLKGLRVPVILSWLRTLIPFKTKPEKKKKDLFFTSLTCHDSSSVQAGAREREKLSWE